MGYEYYYDGMDSGFETFGSVATDAALGITGFLAIFLLLFYFLLLVYRIACYVLQAIGMYTIAKRRGIRHPWLSWLPIGDVWILGSISDQYQYIAKGKISNRRKVLLGLMIGILVAFALIVCVISSGAMLEDTAAYSATFGATMAIVLLLYLGLFAVAIVSAVFQYIALYDVYASCNPDNAVLFLVLSIFLNINPFFIFFNRSKDLGMPPRKNLEQMPVEEPVAEPVAE